MGTIEQIKQITERAKERRENKIEEIVDPSVKYTTEEAMIILGVKSKTTMREKVKQGFLKRMKKGRTEIYFLGKDLISYYQKYGC